MKSQHVTRTTPREGEWWKFSNGEAARIAGVTDANYGVPEVAYVNPKDYRSGFKFNAVHDPMPVKKLRPIINIRTKHLKVFIAI